MDDFRKSEAQHYQIGRLLLDGGEPAELAGRFGVDVAAIEESWRICQEQLSLEWTRRRGEPFRLLAAEELRSEISFCLQCLLTWREQLQRTVDTAPGVLLQSGLKHALRAFEAIYRGEIADTQDVIAGAWALDALRAGGARPVPASELSAAAVWLQGLATGKVAEVAPEERELALQWAKALHNAVKTYNSGGAN